MVFKKDYDIHAQEAGSDNTKLAFIIFQSVQKTSQEPPLEQC